MSPSASHAQLLSSPNSLISTPTSASISPSSQTPRANSPSTVHFPPFFTLPPELRLQIFHYLLTGLHIEWDQNGLLNALNYTTAPDGYRFLPGLPNWLLTSRQFLADGVDQLYRGAVLTRCLGCRGYSSKKTTAPLGCWDDSANADEVRLLDLRRVRAASMEKITICVDPEISPHRDQKTPTLVYRGMEERLTGPLLGYLRLYPRGHELRRVKLTFGLPMVYPLVFGEEEWTVDFEALVGFPSLQHVEFVLSQARRHGLGDNEVCHRSREAYLAEVNEKRARGAVLPLLRNCLRVIAERLVGGGEDRECVVREWSVETQGNGLGDGDKGRGKAVDAALWNETWKLDWHLDVRRSGRTRA